MKLNRNNADINKLRDKKVAVRLVGKDVEIDFRKWLEENGIHFNNENLTITNGIITEICYCVEGNSWDWCDKSWFIEKGYTLYEWEIAEKENILMMYYMRLLKYEFIEYKPEEPKEITFEDALKEMETKVCRSMFSNRCITISGTQFINASNREYTKLALPEIKGEWVVIEE